MKKPLIKLFLSLVFLVALFMFSQGRGADFKFSDQSSATLSYISYLGSRFHFPGAPSPVLAAVDGGGYGYKSMAVLLPLWTITRNIAYVIFAVLFIIAGMMIILRFKMDAKTVVNIENTLPKVIKALILVTFSYAIAGLLVDLMWVLTNLVSTIFDPSDRYKITEAGVAALWGWGLGLAGIAWGAIVRMFGVNISISCKVSGLDIWGLLGCIASTIGAILNIFVTGGAAILGLLAAIIIYLAIVWAIIKVWTSLLGAYVNIILAVIFSPLFLMLEALPGQDAFGKWIRGLLTNLLVFPFVTVLIYVAMILAATGVTAGGGFRVPLLNIDTGSLMTFAGIGILLTIPKALNILEEALKNPPFKHGSAWMEALGGGGAFGQQAYPVVGAPVVGAAQRRWSSWRTARAAASAATGGGGGGGGPAAPLPCLAWDTLISTPDGEKLVSSLKIGMSVWSFDKSGKKIEAKVKQLSRPRVSKSYTMVKFSLSNGKKLLVSFGHPTTSGAAINNLMVGDQIGGVRITAKQVVIYQKGFTCDLLPDSETGIYFASGVPLGSTLLKNWFPGHTYSCHISQS